MLRWRQAGQASAGLFGLLADILFYTLYRSRSSGLEALLRHIFSSYFNIAKRLSMSCHSFRTRYLSCDCRRRQAREKRALKLSTIGPIIFWPVTITPTYIDLLSERRPEALVILPQLGVLIYSRRDLWILGDSGLYIISAINDYLGP